MNVLTAADEVDAAFGDDICRLPARVAAPTPFSSRRPAPEGGRMEKTGGGGREMRPGSQQLFASLFGGVSEAQVRRELTEAFVYGSADIWCVVWHTTGPASPSSP